MKKNLKLESRLALSEYNRGLNEGFSKPSGPDPDYEKYFKDRVAREQQSDCWVHTDSFVRGVTDGFRAKVRMMKAERGRLVRS